MIPDYLFYPSNWASIIGHYWQIFAIIALICLQKVLLLFAIIVPGLKTFISACNYSKTIIAIILLCYQLFALLQLIGMSWPSGQGIGLAVV